MSDATRDWQSVWDGLQRTLGRKWTFHVLRLLSTGDHGFNEMQRALEGPTAKTLSERLTELRCQGLVERHVEATSPPSTRYELTPAGDRFVDLLRELETEVDLVPCGCDQDCEVPSVDAARTRAMTGEEC